MQATHDTPPAYHEVMNEEASKGGALREREEAVASGSVPNQLYPESSSGPAVTLTLVGRNDIQVAGLPHQAMTELSSLINNFHRRGLKKSYGTELTLYGKPWYFRLPAGSAGRYTTWQGEGTSEALLNEVFKAFWTRGYVVSKVTEGGWGKRHRTTAIELRYDPAFTREANSSFCVVRYGKWGRAEIFGVPPSTKASHPLTSIKESYMTHRQRQGCCRSRRPGLISSALAASMAPSSVSDPVQKLQEQGWMPYAQIEPHSTKRAENIVFLRKQQ